MEFWRCTAAIYSLPHHPGAPETMKTGDTPGMSGDIPGVSGDNPVPWTFAELNVLGCLQHC